MKNFIRVKFYNLFFYRNGKDEIFSEMASNYKNAHGEKNISFSKTTGTNYYYLAPIALNESLFKENIQKSVGLIVVITVQLVTSPQTRIITQAGILIQENPKDYVLDWRSLESLKD